MVIITENSGIVNIYAQNQETAEISVTDEKKDNFKKKIAEMKQKNIEVSKKMKKFNFARGQRMEQCASTIHYYKCPCCGKYEITNMERCRDKMCPLCNWVLARQRLINMVDIFNEIDKKEQKYDFYFLTLTIKNVYPKDIREAMQTMSRAWDKMLKRKAAKENLKGWARATEITYNKITRTVHPHYHVILMYEKGTRDILDGSWFKPSWKETLNIGYDPVIDFRPIRPKADNKESSTEDEKEQARIYGAVLETFKYSLKSSDLLDMTQSDFNQLCAGINNKRMVSFGGIIKETKKALGIKDEEESEEAETIENKICSCGAQMLEASATWALASSGYKESFKRSLTEV